MKITQALSGVAVIGLLTAIGPSQAGVMAVSIFEVNNFMVTDTAGTQLLIGTHIGAIVGNNTADTSATLNGVTSNGSLAAPIVPPFFGAIDLPQRCVGTCPPFPENSYSGVGFLPPPSATYAVSDMVLTGTSIDTSPLFPNSGGVDVRTRADVAITGGTNDGTSVTNAGTDVNFTFVALSDLTAQFELDFIIQLRAYLETAAGETGSAQSTVSWNLNVLDLTAGGAEVLNWAPGQLNTSRTASVGPLTNLSVDASGSLTSDPFDFVTGHTYQLSIRHQSLADANFAFAVPEPVMTALFGAGLVVMGLAGRKRR